MIRATKAKQTCLRELRPHIISARITLNIRHVISQPPILYLL